MKTKTTTSLTMLTATGATLVALAALALLLVGSPNSTGDKTPVAYEVTLNNGTTVTCIRTDQSSTAPPSCNWGRYNAEHPTDTPSDPTHTNGAGAHAETQDDPTGEAIVENDVPTTIEPEVPHP